jgi:hypothetical protein
VPWSNSDAACNELAAFCQSIQQTIPTSEIPAKMLEKLRPPVKGNRGAWHTATQPRNEMEHAAMVIGRHIDRRNQVHGPITGTVDSSHMPLLRA